MLLATQIIIFYLDFESFDSVGVRYTANFSPFPGKTTAGGAGGAAVGCGTSPDESWKI